MKKALFKEVMISWSALCNKHLAPLRNKKNYKTGSPAQLLLLQKINKEWSEILILLGWTRQEELAAYKEYAIYSRLMYRQLEKGDQNG